MAFRAPLVLTAVGFAALGGCKDTREPARERAPTPVRANPAPIDASRAAVAPLARPCADAPHVETLAPGLTLETLRPSTRPALEVADPCLRVLRADPAHFNVVLGAGAAESPAVTGRTGPAWADRAGAVAVINASMFHSGGASTGLLIDGETVITRKVNAQFGAFFAARPSDKHAERPPVTLWGRGCRGDTLAGLRRDYRLVVQNYRLLDCDGKALRWKDEKIYSVAAVGVDSRGNVLFIHSRAPYRMASFTEMLLEPGLGLDVVAAMYVEGGPEATLHVRAGARAASFVGSYESLFVENDDNHIAWELPNVLMLVPR